MTNLITLEPTSRGTEEAYFSIRESGPESVKESYKHAHHDSPKGSIIFASEEGGRITSSVSYIAHSVSRDGETGLAYQACGVFTHPDHRGKGLFPKIASYAERELTSRGAKFIFGYPNKNAAPIWTKKLGYSICDTRPILIIPFGGKIRMLDPEALTRVASSPRRVFLDAREIKLWKSSRYGSDLVEAEYYTNYVFGRAVAKKVAGVPLRVFVVGAYEINKPHLMESLLRRATRQAGCQVCRISANSGSAMLAASLIKRRGNLTEPFIVKGLKWRTVADDVEVAGGVKDVY